MAQVNAQPSQLQMPAKVVVDKQTTLKKYIEENGNRISGKYGFKTAFYSKTESFVNLFLAPTL